MVRRSSASARAVLSRFTIITVSSVACTAVDDFGLDSRRSVHKLTHHEEALASLGEFSPTGWYLVEKPSDDTSSRRSTAVTPGGNATGTDIATGRDTHLVDSAYVPTEIGKFPVRGMPATLATQPRTAPLTSFVQLGGDDVSRSSNAAVRHVGGRVYLRRDDTSTLANDGHDIADVAASERVQRKLGAELADTSSSRLWDRRWGHDGKQLDNAALLQMRTGTKSGKWASANSGSPDEIQWDGKVQVARDVQSGSELVKLEAAIDECLTDATLPTCWQKYGSYGIRRLYAEEWDDIVSEGLVRPDWMSHPNAQKAKLFSLTFPGTHHSGAYTFQGEHEDKSNNGYGVLTQQLNIAQQLEVGIRFFDFNVAWGINAKRLYVSHGYLTIPLKLALQAIQKFLTAHSSEVVVISIRKDKAVLDYNDDPEYLKPLQDEERDPFRVPGQTVHTEVMAVFGVMLATYERLSSLPADESLENPSIGQCQEMNMRVFYFYEGQQVVCPDLDSCEKTPGWTVNSDGRALPFGPPLKLGLRNKAANANAGQPLKVVEPGCIFHSETVQSQDKPDQVARQVKIFTEKMQDHAKLRVPTCYPEREKLSEPGQPTLFYIADAFVTWTKKNIVEQQDVLKRSQYIFTRGEGFAAKSEAERVNFLILADLLKPGLQYLFRKPNAFLFDYPAPLLISRIIDSVQGRKDCGWAVYCKHTGSCWARSLSRPAREDEEAGSTVDCYGETDMEAYIRDYVEGKSVSGMWGVHIALGFYLLVLLAHWRCFLWMCCKSVKKPARSDGILGIVVCASLGDPCTTESASTTEAPRLLRVQGTDDECDGLYELVEGKAPNNMPLWKWKEGDEKAWIFCGNSEQWFLGDEDEAQLNFDCSLGNFCSEHPHGGKLPHQIEQGTWMKFDYDKKEWTKEPGLVIEEHVEQQT